MEEKALEWGEIFYYDAETGLLHWKQPLNTKHRKGDVAGTINNKGYWIVQVNKKLHLCHRIIWELLFGKLGKKDQIDHVNHVRSDNRLPNLRKACYATNSKNRSINSSNKTGVSGITKRPNKPYFEVGISSGKKKYWLGQTKDFFEACCLRKSAELKFGFHKNNGR